MKPRTSRIAEKLSQEQWHLLPVQTRRTAIAALRREIARRAVEIAHAISEECSRPLFETFSQEVLPAMAMCRYLERTSRTRLRHSVHHYTAPGFLRKTNILIREAIGSVALVTPRHFPFSLTLMSVAYLLLPGNTVVIKPSEHSSMVGPLISELLVSVGLCPTAASVVHGGPEAVDRLIEDPSVAKVVFFGRRQAGKSVAEKCVKEMKPFVLELGGGTTAIVCADAPVELAAAGIAWSSFYANGQSCVGTRRVFVDRRVYRRFVSLLVKETAIFEQAGVPRISAGDALQLRTAVEDACDRGGTVLRGGHDSPSEIGLRAVPCIIVTGGSTDAALFQEEVLGPVLAVAVADGPEHGMRLAASCCRPLGVSIWSRSRRAAMSLARQAPSAMVWLNDTSFGLPSLPWGGWGEAGWGSLFSWASLHEAVRLRSVSAHPSRFARRRFWWHPYTLGKERLLRAAAKAYRL